MEHGISTLRTYLHSTPMPYTGPELRPHFLLTHFKLAGNAVAAFLGPCEVKTEHLVDWEDRLVNDHIRAQEMVHLLGEFFGMPLREGVWVQRFAMACAAEVLREFPKAAKITRMGDDLWIGDRKLSVSIVTASPVSSLLHCGINVDSAGAPVKAIGLQDLEIDPRVFAKRWLERLAQEWDGVAWACTKVRPVV